jgi:hypothetical protein
LEVQKEAQQASQVSLEVDQVVKAAARKPGSPEGKGQRKQKAVVGRKVEV